MSPGERELEDKRSGLFMPLGHADSVCRVSKVSEPYSVSHNPPLLHPSFPISLPHSPKQGFLGTSPHQTAVLKSRLSTASGKTQTKTIILLLSFTYCFSEIAHSGLKKTFYIVGYNMYKMHRDCIYRSINYPKGRT